MTAPPPEPAPAPGGFAEALAAGRLVFDGPMGTMLLARGHREPLEELNASAPDAVREVHRAYVQAGASALRANTLLARDGEVADGSRLAARGLALAREVAPPGVWVGASIGAAHRARPEHQRSGLARDTFHATVARQAAALADADFVALETFLQPGELDEALTAVRESYAGPVLALFTLRSDLPARLDAASTQRVYGALEAFLEVVTAHDVAGTGVNCVPPGAVLEVARDVLARRANRPWGLLPSAPSVSRGAGVAGRSRRGAPVDQRPIVAAIEAAVDAGAAFVGACCGCTPDTIRRIASVVSAPPGTRRAAGAGPPSRRSRPRPRHAAGAPFRPQSRGDDRQRTPPGGGRPGQRRGPGRRPAGHTGGEAGRPYGGGPGERAPGGRPPRQRGRGGGGRHGRPGGAPHGASEAGRGGQQRGQGGPRIDGGGPPRHGGGGPEGGHRRPRGPRRRGGPRGPRRPDGGRGGPGRGGRPPV